MEFDSTIYFVGQQNIGKQSLIEQIQHAESILNCEDTKGEMKLKLKLKKCEDLSRVPSNAFGVVLMYDITKRDSFSYILDMSAQIQSKRLCPLRAIIGTHLDQENLRVVELQEAQKLKHELNCLLFEVSLSTSVNVLTFKKQFQIRALFAFKDLVQQSQKLNLVTQSSNSERDLDQNNKVVIVVGMTGSGRHTLINLLLQGKEYFSCQDSKSNLEVKLFFRPRERINLADKPFGVIFVYDITKKQTYDHVAQMQTDTGVILRAVVGTHYDQQDKRQVPSTLASELKQQHRCILFEVSVPEQLNTATFSRQLAIRAVYAAKDQQLTDTLNSSLGFSQAKPPSQLVAEPQPMLVQSPKEPRFSSQQAPRPDQPKKSVPLTAGDLVVSLSESQPSMMSDLRPGPSRVITRYAPQLVKPSVEHRDDVYESNPSVNSSIVANNPLKPTRKALLQQRIQVRLDKSSPKIVHEEEEPVLLLEFEIDGVVHQMNVKRDDNAYEISKQFVSKNGLDQHYMKQIAALVMSKLGSYLEEERKALIEQKKDQFRQYKFDRVPVIKIPSERETKREKPLFKFELRMGNKCQMIAYRRGDDPKVLADQFLRLQQLNREQYYGFVIQKIQESIALYQMQIDE